jgi:vacuolar-type H+-ATPase subunit C/Vma6
MFLGDVNTRARGLRTRLLGSAELDRLMDARSLFALQRALSNLGIVPADGPATPEALERAVRRRAAGLMAILGRWCTDDRRPVFAVLFEDEDRRSIQAALRGAEQAAGTDARMSGLVPTQSLSERALRVLASQPTMADVVRMLVLWGHPFGRPLIDAVSGPHPSLFKAEVELQRAFAQRALAHAHRGGRALVDYARQVIDAMNASSVLLHFPERDEDIADSIFIDGGSQIDRDGFEEMMRNESFEQARRALLIRLQDSALGSAFREEAENLSTLEAAVLRAQIAEQRRLARLRPDGAAPTISFALELRAEVLDLRRIIWGVSLGAPQALMQTSMVAS